MNNIAYKIKGILYFDSKALPGKKVVLKRMGVRCNTFAGNIISRLYDFYFKGALNFNKDYHKYYKREYRTIVDYMEQHHNISHENAVLMSKGSFSMKNCSLDSIELSFMFINEDENIVNAFSEAVGGIIDEDSDGFYY